MRLIDADLLIDNFGELTVELWLDSVEEAEIVSLIGNAPTIDAVEVVRGEWKRKIVDNGFNADWVCSECGYRIKTDFVNYNYCPKCGARMKGADDDNND